jgi:hypothetical protein
MWQFCHAPQVKNGKTLNSTAMPAARRHRAPSCRAGWRDSPRAKAIDFMDDLDQTCTFS